MESALTQLKAECAESEELVLLMEKERNVRLLGINFEVVLKHVKLACTTSITLTT